MTRYAETIHAQPRRKRIDPCKSGANPEEAHGARSAPAESKRLLSSNLLELAKRCQRSGRLQEAETLYERILKLDPDHPEALHCSGLIAHQKGQSERAVALITRSIALEPLCAIYLVNLGMVFATGGDFDRASVKYRAAIALDPRLESAHHELGNALRNQGNLIAAAKSYSLELSINPEAHNTMNTLGSVLKNLGRYDQAVTCYRRVIALDPGCAEAHNNLGVVLDQLDRSHEAVESYRQALLHRPTFAEAYCNLANALNNVREYGEAASSCEKAIALQPDLPEAHLNLGNTLKALGKLNDAARSYQRAIAIMPEYSGAHNNLADVFKEQGKLQQAMDSFGHALHCTSPDPTAYSNMLYFCAFTRHNSPSAERRLAEGWEKAFLTDKERLAARQRMSLSSGVFPRRPRIGRKLRLGILTAELGSHAVACFLEPFLRELDHSRFDLTLFTTKLNSGVDADRLRKLAETHHYPVIWLLGVPDAEAAERVRRERIDVLIETTGHTYGCRLGIIAHRAAPVQCSYIGYWSTTGLTEMDWFITGTGSDLSVDAHFTEGLWRLPRLAHSYQGDPSLADDGWAPDPDGTVWLGSFNYNPKMREETLGLWARVLHALPEAKLLLEDRGTQDEETHQRIRSTLAGFAIEQGRVCFIPFVPGHERHMRLYDRLDIALDTIPFNSGTTAFDALWMSVPLITLKGDWLGGTLAGAVVEALGHPEWVAKDADEFVSIVCLLARDVEGRKQLRKNQRSRMAASPLCDAKDLSRSLEDAFEAMYDRWLTAACPGEFPHPPLACSTYPIEQAVGAGV